MLFGAWYPLVEVSKLDANAQSPDDRFFLKDPIPVPGTAFSRKSFKRSEIQKYKKA